MLKNTLVNDITGSYLVRYCRVVEVRRVYRYHKDLMDLGSGVLKKYTYYLGRNRDNTENRTL